MRLKPAAYIASPMGGGILQRDNSGANHGKALILMDCHCPAIVPHSNSEYIIPMLRDATLPEEPCTQIAYVQLHRRRIERR